MRWLKLIGLCVHAYALIGREVVKRFFWIAVVLLILIPTGSVRAETQSEIDVLTGKSLMSQCGYKYAGKDQVSTFTVVLKDSGGNEKKSVYLRLWKDYDGEGQVLEKMMLFSTFPPDSKGGAFMRTTYIPESEKVAEQWIYLPVLRKIRRVTIRDPGDRFLNSDLTYQDVSYRGIDEDEHFYIGKEVIAGVSLHKVESTPRTVKGEIYSKRLFWIEKDVGDDGWDNCLVKKIAYYDVKGVLLKEQLLNWQRVKGAWMWDRVVVTDVQERHESVFMMSDVRVDTGLSKRQFSKRAMKSGFNLKSR
ncbi:MAG: outer membrane lipoprotein-sorting protein [Gammaproteobacteria bacterium]|nr:outer membrane lipoprotein-sorting protein [Gammaproteobacteria bacterium]